MKPCMTCGKDFDSSTCPGHVERTAIKDHCPQCVADGRCSAVNMEVIGGDLTAFDRLEPGVPFVSGYRDLFHNL